jgi:hypothetical protein
MAKTMLTDQIRPGVLTHELCSDSTLHVVAVVSNPARFHSRYRLFRAFQDRMRATANVALHTVELCLGDRQAEVGADLTLRSPHELWHKENLINLGISNLLPTDWRYVAWVDADVEFDRSDWALETIHALQHHPVVQPWSECADMGPHNNIMHLHRSFSSLVQRGVEIQINPDDPYPYGHSGFAWACTRYFYENVQGLIDSAILGSADHHMAFAMIGQVQKSVHGGASESFKAMLEGWQRRAYRETSGHLGHVPGHLRHYFHGPKSARKYRERWQVLVDHGFDPDHDLRRDAQGVLYLVGKPHLTEDVRRYMRQRNEDSVDEG